MHKLFLIRHGHAVPEIDDRSRPLNRVGRQETERMASFLKDHGISCEHFFHSSKLRSIQTAEIFKDLINPGATLIESNSLSPLSDSHMAKEIVDGISKPTVIVGHLPHLQKLASLLLTGSEESLNIQFEPSSVLCLNKEETNYSIIWHLSPSIIIENNEFDFASNIRGHE